MITKNKENLFFLFSKSDEEEIIRLPERGEDKRGTADRKGEQGNGEQNHEKKDRYRSSFTSSSLPSQPGHFSSHNHIDCRVNPVHSVFALWNGKDSYSYSLLWRCKVCSYNCDWNRWRTVRMVFVLLLSNDECSRSEASWWQPQPFWHLHSIVFDYSFKKQRGKCRFPFRFLFFLRWQHHQRG